MGKGAIFLVFFFRGGVVWVAVHCTETVRPEIYFRACQVENPSHIVRKDTRVWTIICDNISQECEDRDRDPRHQINFAKGKQ